jgi:transcriptional regulator with XRE-family HTH domain
LIGQYPDAMTDAAEKLSPRRQTRGHRTPIEALDRRIGERLHFRRMQLGIEAGALDLALGQRFGTVERCEKAERAIPASLLYRLAVLLDVEMSFFFSEKPLPSCSLPPAEAIGEGPDLAEARRFLALYVQMGDRKLRTRVRELVKGIARTAPTPADSDDSDRAD